MKILWAGSDFLHPANKGGHIRTLETLTRLHRRHEIHYAALDLAQQVGGVERSSEYCTKAYPIAHSAPERSTLTSWLQLAAGLFSPLPLTVSRYQSDTMRGQIDALYRQERFDVMVCDFLRTAVNISDLGNSVLFQHNVEALIWKRHAEHAPSPLHRRYFESQYERMARYEGQVCRAVKSIIAVSCTDARTMQALYGVKQVAAVSTGVDLSYFDPPDNAERNADLVFLGSMDWMPNIDGIQWFVEQVMPLMRCRRPDCSLVIAGRHPPRSILRLAAQYPGIKVTGTVADIRPYLWASAVSIVPLRIGGGTRLKIYEAMAAKIPVVSTTIGAEGLDVRHGEDIFLADSARDFAECCLTLLDDAAARRRLVATAWEKVSTCYSWDVVAREFEALLVSASCGHGSATSSDRHDFLPGSLRGV
jgi:glycosyltransferase involved in cell wall biosynthesis